MARGGPLPVNNTASNAIWGQRPLRQEGEQKPRFANRAGREQPGVTDNDSCAGRLGLTPVRESDIPI